MSLPFDSNDPAIRLMFKHIRLQALTPMAVLINLITTILCVVVARPSIQAVNRQYPTPLTPKDFMIGIYWLVTYVGLIGYCVILLIARKPETKETIVKGPGLFFMFAMYSAALTNVFFTLKIFIAALVFAAITLLLQAVVFVSLLYHPTSRTRPLDSLLIHAPMRLFLAVAFLQDLPHVLFIVLGWYFDPKDGEEIGAQFAWRAVAFIASFNIVGLVNVALRQDLVWTLAGMWISLGMLMKQPKPPPVFGFLVAFVVLYPVTFVASVLIARARAQKKQGAIALPTDEQEAEEAEIARARALANQDVDGGHAQSGV